MTTSTDQIAAVKLQMLRGERPALTPELLLALEPSAPEGMPVTGVMGRRPSAAATALRDLLCGTLCPADLSQDGDFFRKVGEARISAAVLKFGHKNPLKALNWGLKATEARHATPGPDALMLAPLMLGLQAVASRPPTSTPGQWAVRAVRGLNLTGEDWARITPRLPHCVPDPAALTATGSWGELEWLSLHVFDAPGERRQLPMIHPGWKRLLTALAWDLKRPERPEDRLTYSEIVPATLETLIGLASEVTVMTDQTRCFVDESTLRERGADPETFHRRKLMDDAGQAEYDLSVARTRGLVTHCMPSFYTQEGRTLTPCETYTRAGWQLTLSPLWREANNLSALTGRDSAVSTLSAQVLMRAHRGVLGLHGETAAQAREDLAVAQVLIRAREQAQAQGNALAGAVLSQTLTWLWSVSGSLSPKRSFPAHRQLMDTLRQGAGL